MSSTTARPLPRWAVAVVDRPLDWLLMLVPIAIAIGLFELALSDGGQHLETQTWVQTAVVLLFAIIVWARGVPRGPVSWSMIGLLAAVTLSTLFSVRPEASIRESLLWLMYLSFFAVAASTLHGAVAIRRFVDASVAIGGWLCLVALFIFWGADNPGMRWYSTFYWPNPFAAFMLLLLPIAFVRYLHARGNRESFAHGAVTLLLGVALILTYSRGAWISLAATLPLAAAILRPASWASCARRIAILALLGAAAVVLLTRGTALESSTRGVHGSEAMFEDLSIHGRLEFWGSGVRMFLDHPAFGTGAGTFGAAHPFYQRDVRFYAKDVHNKYLQIAAELGLVGVGLFAAVVLSVSVLWRQTLRITRGTQEYPLVAGIGLGLLAFALHSAVDMDWLFPANPAMAFALIGVLAAARGSLGSEIVQRPTRSAAWRMLAVAGLVLTVAVTQVLQLAQRQYAEGQRLALNGRWAAAASEYSSAVRWNPLAARYWAGLANASTHLMPPREDLAVASLRRAIAIDSMDAGYPLQLGALLMAQTETSGLAEAETLLRQALYLDLRNRPDTYRTLAALYVREGRLDDASRIYSDGVARYRGQGLGRGSILYLQLWPQVTALFLDAAEFSLHQGNVPRAAEILEQLLADDPASVVGALRLSDLYVQEGRLRDARRVLEATAVRVPKSPEIEAALQRLP